MSDDKEEKKVEQEEVEVEDLEAEGEDVKGGGFVGNMKAKKVGLRRNERARMRPAQPDAVKMPKSPLDPRDPRSRGGSR